MSEGMTDKGTGRDQEHGHDNWRVNPPDPQPENTPGLTAGNSVQPGDTPPIESSTSSTGYQQPDLPSERTNYLVLGGMAVALAVVALLLAVRFL